MHVNICLITISSTLEVSDLKNSKKYLQQHKNIGILERYTK